MKFLNNKKSLGKSLIHFLIFFLIQPGFSEELQLLDSQLDSQSQELICNQNTKSIETEEICLDDKIAIEKVAVCSLYTSADVAEALCLKNKKLSYKKVLQCYIGTSELIEQICLIGSDASSRIVSQFETTEDSLVIIREIENTTTEIETILDGLKVKFDIAAGKFVFNM